MPVQANPKPISKRVEKLRSSRKPAPVPSNRPADDEPYTRKHHLDKRAETLLATGTRTDRAAVEDDSDDDLLSTQELALWLGVSLQWLIIGRSKKYGPKFVKISTRRVAYRRPDVRAWLESRTYSNTSEYPRGAAAKLLT